MKRIAIVVLLSLSTLFLFGCDWMSLFQSISEDTSTLSSALTSISDGLTTDSGLTTESGPTTTTTTTADEVSELEMMWRQMINAELTGFSAAAESEAVVSTDYQLEMGIRQDSVLLQETHIRVFVLIDTQTPYLEIRTQTPEENLSVIDAYGTPGQEKLYLHQFLNQEWISSEILSDSIDMDLFASMTETVDMAPEFPMVPQGAHIVPIENGYRITFGWMDIIEDPDWGLYLQSMAMVDEEAIATLEFIMTLHFSEDDSQIRLELAVEDVAIPDQPGMTFDITQTFSVAFPTTYTRQSIDSSHYVTGEFAPTEIDPESDTYAVDDPQWVPFSGNQVHYLKFGLPKGLYLLPEGCVGIFLEDGTRLFGGRVAEITETGIYYLGIDKGTFGSFLIAVETLWSDEVLSSDRVTHTDSGTGSWKVQIPADPSPRVLKIQVDSEGLDYLLVDDFLDLYELQDGGIAWFYIPANDTTLLRIQTPSPGTFTLTMEWIPVTTASFDPQDWPELNYPANTTYIVLVPGAAPNASYRLTIGTAGSYALNFSEEPYLFREGQTTMVTVRNEFGYVGDWTDQTVLWLEAGTYYIDVSSDSETPFFVARPKIIKLS